MNWDETSKKNYEGFDPVEEMKEEDRLKDKIKKMSGIIFYII